MFNFVAIDYIYMILVAFLVVFYGFIVALLVAVVFIAIELPIRIWLNNHKQ